MATSGDCNLAIDIEAQCVVVDKQSVGGDSLEGAFEKTGVIAVGAVDRPPDRMPWRRRRRTISSPTSHGKFG